MLNFDSIELKFYLDYHRDATPRARLNAFANQNELPSDGDHHYNANIDTCDTIDMDIDDLIIKPWCSRFCPRCYIYK